MLSTSKIFQVKEAVARSEAAEKKAYEGHLDSQDKLEMYQVG